MNLALKSLVAGTAITLVLFLLAWGAAEIGQIDLSYLLYWQGYILGILVPCKTTMVLGLTQCQVTTESVAAFYAGIPLGIFVYSLLVYIPWAIIRRLKG